MDANTYYLDRYLQNQEKQDQLRAMFEAAIQEELKAINEAIENIKATAQGYQDDYCINLDEDVKEILENEVRV